MSSLLLEPAIASYDEPLEVKTDEAWYNLGIVLMNAGQFEQALASFDKVLEIEPDLFQVWFNRGIALGKLGRHAEALHCFDRVLEIQRDFHEAFYNRGVSLLYLGRHEEAITSYDKALEIQPDFCEAWNNRGVALNDLERHSEAIASYNKALSFKSDYHYAWNNWGNALLQIGQYSEALTRYDKALEFKPDFCDVWNNRGGALASLERLDEALTSFDTALKIQPNHHHAWYNQGITLKNLGRYEEALASYDKALEFKPNFCDAWNNRGSLLFNLGCYEEALTSFDNVLKIKPDYYDAWYNRGNALWKLKRLDEALASYDNALEFKSDYHEAWNNRGLLLLVGLRRLDDAVASFDKVTELKPDHDKAWYARAFCYASQGNFEQAIESLRRAINLNPDKYREKAKTDFASSSIREDERFQALIQEARNEEGEIRELRHNVSWEEFENILAEMGDNRSSRLAYDQGTLEITMPSQKHEYYKEIIRDLIKYLAEELDLDCESLGSTTWKRKDILKGAEPDNCFYIQNEPAIRGVKPNIDLSKNPPPDLILEVDHTSPSLNRLPIYAGLGIPEIWIYDMNILRIYQLEAGKYKETDTSLAFGTFPIKEIPSFIKKNITASPRELRKSFRAWVGQYLTATPQETEWEDGEIDEHEWLRAATSNPAFDFLKDPEEDIYTLADGKPFND
jgi:tetratricopeptide (TPR) repeat protein